MKSVSIFEQAPGSLPDMDAMFEPGFGQTRSLQPDQADPQWCAQLVRQLERQIPRSPNDLTLHTRRVHALLAAGFRGDRVFAAALDLYAVLGGNGMALQRRIHELIFPVLEDEQRAALVAARSGAVVSAGTAARYCLLPQGQMSDVRLVEAKADEIAAKITSVDFDLG